MVLALIAIIVFTAFFLAYSNIKLQDSRKKLAEDFKTICKNKTQNTDFEVFPFVETDFLCLDKEISEATQSYLKELNTLFLKDKEAKSILSILNSSDNSFQKEIDAFIEKFPNSILLEYVEYLNVIKKLGVRQDFTLLPTFETKYTDSVYLENLKLYELLYIYIDFFEKISEASSSSTTDKEIEQIANLCEEKESAFRKAYPSSKYTIEHNRREKELEERNEEKKKDGIWSIDCYVDKYRTKIYQKL